MVAMGKTVCPNSPGKVELATALVPRTKAKTRRKSSFETSSVAWSAWACDLKLGGYDLLRALGSGFRRISDSGERGRHHNP
jgi:hypothetical protein